MNRRAFSCSIYVIHAGRILLIKHKRLGCWLPVGGELEHLGSVNGVPILETPSECARRELFEETGLRGTFAELGKPFPGTPDGLLGYEEHNAGSKGLHMNFKFLCFVNDDIVKSDGSYSEHRWFTISEIMQLTETTFDVQVTALSLHAYARAT